MLDNYKNPIIFGSSVGIIEHFAGLAPRTIIDYKQYYQKNYKIPLEKNVLSSNILRYYKGGTPYLSGIGIGHTWLFSFREMSKKDNMPLKDIWYGMIGKAGHDLFILPGDTIRMNSNIKNISSIDAIKHIYIKNGLSGFFKGLVPSLCMNIPSGAIEFGTIASLERIYGNDGVKPFLYGAFAGISSSILTSPLDILKTHKQLDQNKSYKNVYSTILSSEGWKGLFRGAMLRSFQCCISYGTYEWLCKNLNLNID